ncbi:MAG: hypothetical protein V3V14_02250 [Saprospiraceae bacterium]
MKVDVYSRLDFVKSVILPQEVLSAKFIEKILLFLIAFLGIVGSLYVFSISSNSNNSPNYNNLSFVAAASTDNVFDELAGKKKFKRYIKIKGDKKTGSVLNFTFLKDRKETRYVLEMGNGERMIITSNIFPYKYNTPGKYLLELKTIKRGLITTIATKEIKIK